MICRAAAHQIRLDPQRQNRQGAWPDYAHFDAITRRRNNRIAALAESDFCCTAYVAFWPKPTCQRRRSMSAYRLYEQHAETDLLNGRDRHPRCVRPQSLERHAAEPAECGHRACTRHRNKATLSRRNRCQAGGCGAIPSGGDGATAPTCGDKLGNATKRAAAIAATAMA